MTEAKRVFIFLSSVGQLEREVLRGFAREGTVIFLTENAGEKLPPNVMDFNASGGFRNARNLLKEGKDNFSILINLNALYLFNTEETVPWGEAVRETLHFTSEAIQHLGADFKGGRIINILPLPPVAENVKEKYKALRAGYAGLADIWGSELGKRNVTINTIVPGYFMNPASQSGRIMLGRPGRPNELASVVQFLASSEAAYITNAVIPVDGGLIS